MPFKLTNNIFLFLFKDFSYAHSYVSCIHFEVNNASLSFFAAEIIVFEKGSWSFTRFILIRNWITNEMQYICMQKTFKQRTPFVFPNVAFFYTHFINSFLNLQIVMKPYWYSDHNLTFFNYFLLFAYIKNLISIFSRYILKNFKTTGGNCFDPRIYHFFLFFWKIEFLLALKIRVKFSMSLSISIATDYVRTSYDRLCSH